MEEGEVCKVLGDGDRTTFIAVVFKEGFKSVEVGIDCCEGSRLRKHDNGTATVADVGRSVVVPLTGLISSGNFNFVRLIGRIPDGILSK